MEWVPRDRLRPNAYNPNHQAPPEYRLLKVSILEDGWTQPLVADRATGEIVDGEHRWRISGDPAVAALTGGLVPVVWIDRGPAGRMLATIRHNRARGEHGVLPMGKIVRDLLAAGMAVEDVCFRLQMEDEEVERLAERSGLPVVVGERQVKEFGPAWEPGVKNE
jgi:ParB-like chromosome segregation protein Spo0J